LDPEDDGGDQGEHPSNPTTKAIPDLIGGGPDVSRRRDHAHQRRWLGDLLRSFDIDVGVAYILLSLAGIMVFMLWMMSY